MNIEGRSALVTGAGVGIGRACAEALGKSGAFVGIHYHTSSDGAEESLSFVRAAGGDGVLLRGDLTVEGDAIAVVDAFTKRAGRLDILVNNAGALLGRASIADTSLDLWNRTLAANLTSAFLITRQSIPHLRSAAAPESPSRIINILSLSTQTGGANGAGAYAAAKGGLAVFTRTLARELAPNVTTNSLCPGVIETRHHEVASTPEAMENYRKQTPMARNGKADEVAAAVLYLAGPGGAFTNGAIIDINGGRFLR